MIRTPRCPGAIQAIQVRGTGVYVAAACLRCGRRGGRLEDIERTLSATVGEAILVIPVIQANERRRKEGSQKSRQTPDARRQ